VTRSAESSEVNVRFRRRKLHDQRGATLVEYALLAGLISLGTVSTIDYATEQAGNEFPKPPRRSRRTRTARSTSRPDR
jgi:Flp pilus assembly pilin Flp